MTAYLTTVFLHVERLTVPWVCASQISSGKLTKSIPVLFVFHVCLSICSCSVEKFIHWRAHCLSLCLLIVSTKCLCSFKIYYLPSPHWPTVKPHAEAAHCCAYAEQHLSTVPFISCLSGRQSLSLSDPLLHVHECPDCEMMPDKREKEGWKQKERWSEACCSCLRNSGMLPLSRLSVTRYSFALPLFPVSWILPLLPPDPRSPPFTHKSHLWLAGRGARQLGHQTVSSPPWGYKARGEERHQGRSRPGSRPRASHRGFHGLSPSHGPYKDKGGLQWWSPHSEQKD